MTRHLDYSLTVQRAGAEWTLADFSRAIGRLPLGADCHRIRWYCPYDFYYGVMVPLERAAGGIPQADLSECQGVSLVPSKEHDAEGSTGGSRYTVMADPESQDIPRPLFLGYPVVFTKPLFLGYPVVFTQDMPGILLGVTGMQQSMGL